jgi:DNA-binding NarL/FixJ family response regulator
VLVVDDDASFAEALAAVLDADGRFEVVGRAESGGDAVRLAEQLHPDAILMDLAMPGVDAVEVTREIGSRLPAARIIAVSGSDYSERALEVRLAGALDYVRKSRIQEDLVEALLSATGGQR